jgi:hypothetical protein
MFENCKNPTTLNKHAVCIIAEPIQVQILFTDKEGSFRFAGVFFLLELNYKERENSQIQ